MILLLLLVSSANASPQYGPALDAVQRALLIQTGITQEINRMADEANRRLTYFIDSETPFSSKDIYFGVGAAYSIGVRQEIVQTFNNPWIGGVRHTIVFGAFTKAFNIQFSF